MKLYSDLRSDFHKTCGMDVEVSTFKLASGVALSSRDRVAIVYIYIYLRREPINVLILHAVSLYTFAFYVSLNVVSGF